MTKKTIISLSVLYAAVIIIMLVLIPVEQKNEYYKNWGSLAVRAETDERARFAIENYELYPEQWFKMLYNDEDFELAYNYPFMQDSYENMSFTEDELNSPVPALYMDDPRWVYEDLSIKSFGCAALTITMANLAVRHNSEADPVKVLNYAAEMGYYGFGGIDMNFVYDILTHFGLSAEEHFFDRDKGERITETELKSAVDTENSIVMAAVNGETFGNHAVIIRGYDENGFYINDPADPENTEAVWDFSVFENELSYYWLIS